MVATTGDELVMVDQYRPTIREQCLELPAGIVEDDESYTAAGARELREETGFEAAGVGHRRRVVFDGRPPAPPRLRLRRGPHPVERDLDDNEFLSVTPCRSTKHWRAPVASRANDATIEGVLLHRLMVL